MGTRTLRPALGDDEEVEKLRWDFETSNGRIDDLTSFRTGVQMQDKQESR